VPNPKDKGLGYMSTNGFVIEFAIIENKFSDLPVNYDIGVEFIASVRATRRSSRILKNARKINKVVTPCIVLPNLTTTFSTL
jgi:hypothetical protein